MMIDIEDVVTKTEIAEILGVGPSAVSNWKRRHTDFPKPIKTFHTGRNRPTELYDIKQVHAWFDAHVRGTMTPEKIEHEIARLNKLKETLENANAS